MRDVLSELNGKAANGNKYKSLGINSRLHVINTTTPLFLQSISAGLSSLFEAFFERTIGNMTTKYLPTDTLPYTIECNVCGARFQRMIDYEEHESTHDVVASVEDLDAGPSPISDQCVNSSSDEGLAIDAHSSRALSPDEGLSEPLVFHFGATGTSFFTTSM